MDHEQKRPIYMYSLIISGVIVSVLSALEPHWEALALLCGRFGQGCRQAESFDLFSIPLAWWGMGFYLSLAVFQRFKPSWVFWAVAAGVGVEVALVQLMVALNFFCLFCMLNAIVVVLLLLVSFRRKAIWQFVSICLVGYIVSNAFIMGENHLNGENANATSAARQQGDDTKVVTIWEFSDYRCPACKRMHPVSNALKDKYKDRVRWVFKDFPLRNHKNSDRLAEAARCAEAMGQFAAFQDLLFDSEPLPDLVMLQDFAAMVELDVAEFTRCYEERHFADKVREDKRSGQAAGVNSTPTFIINGELITGGLTFEAFSDRIDKAMKEREK